MIKITVNLHFIQRGSDYDNLASYCTQVTAVGNGTAVITAYALDGSGVTAQCKVTVN